MPLGLLRARPASPQPYATGHDGLPTLRDVYVHERVLKTPAMARDFTAQLFAFEERKRTHPGRARWSPVDQSRP